MEQPKFSGAICKGAFDFGNHCGACEKCKYYGWVKEKPPKIKILSAPDIVPGKTYMQRHTQGLKALVKITCDDEAGGWLRGHVRLDCFNSHGRYYTANAYGTYLTGTSKGYAVPLQLTREKDDEPWQFVNLSRSIVLHEVPEGYIEDEIQQLERQIEKLERSKQELFALLRKG